MTHKLVMGQGALCGAIRYYNGDDAVPDSGLLSQRFVNDAAKVTCPDCIVRLAEKVKAQLTLREQP